MKVLPSICIERDIVFPSIIPQYEELIDGNGKRAPSDAMKERITSLREVGFQFDKVQETWLRPVPVWRHGAIPRSTSAFNLSERGLISRPRSPCPVHFDALYAVTQKETLRRNCRICRMLPAYT